MLTDSWWWSPRFRANPDGPAPAVVSSEYLTWDRVARLAALGPLPHGAFARLFAGAARSRFDVDTNDADVIAGLSFADIELLLGDLAGPAALWSPLRATVSAAPANDMVVFTELSRLHAAGTHARAVAAALDSSGMALTVLVDTAIMLADCQRDLPTDAAAAVFQ